jgi:hypothetical protein
MGEDLGSRKFMFDRAFLHLPFTEVG